VPDVQDRVVESLADLLARHEGEAVLVVGHGMALALMCCTARGVDVLRFSEHLPPNAGVVALTFLGGELVEARTRVGAETAVGSEAPR
jgi:broad specificity phosphatase PhoE